MARQKKIPIVNPKWFSACVERWRKVHKNDFVFISNERPSLLEENSKNKKLATGIAFSEMETFNKGTLSSMNDEVSFFFIFIIGFF